LTDFFIHSGLDAVGQLSALCKYASDKGYTIRAVGTGSSWSRLTHTKDILLDMTDLKKFITPAPVSRSDNANKEHVDIEVQAGMRVVDFVEQLDTKYGLALKMMGNYAGQTVAGVANTSTHGSGLNSGTMVRKKYETNSSTLNGDSMILWSVIPIKIKSSIMIFKCAVLAFKYSVVKFNYAVLTFKYSIVIFKYAVLTF